MAEAVMSTGAHPEVPALQMKGICKSFIGVQALRNVDLEVRPGEVLGLVGENGAGKSTLMKILSGAYVSDGGELVVFGERVSHPTPASMMARGIAVIHQELSLSPHLSVAENIYLGRLPRNRLGMIDWREAERAASQLTSRLGLNVDPRTPVQTLSIAQRQMVEIAKALSQDARILVLDEPSAVLGDQELEGLFTVIRRLAEDGVALIYISHRLVEVFDLTDRVVVLRDGTHVTTRATSDLNADSLVSHMVGRDVSDIYPDQTRTRGEVLLTARGLRNKRLHGIDLDVRAGEIVGIAGLAGAGRTELLRAIGGADPLEEGTVEVDNQRVRLTSPRLALRSGIGLVPEDRKSQGLFLRQSVQFNINVSHLSDLGRGGLLHSSKERTYAEDYVTQLGVRTPNVQTPVATLSGGNQQKCVLARLLGAGCRVLLIDEPTRGVDVGAKQDIYRRLAEFAANGAAILMVSSELPEVLGLADRILVMHEGRIQAELPGDAASEESILWYATGHDQSNGRSMSRP